MARTKGKFVLDTNYELSVRKPFDARTLVPSYNDLILEANWLNENNKSIAYNGMIVAVANTSDTTKNGIYFLFDPECTSSIKTPIVTNPAHWIKVGETGDIADFVERLVALESELEDFESRISALEADQAVETYGYFSSLPITGVAGKLYAVIDTGKTYIWYNDAYLPVGGGESEQPDIIFGGSAD